MDWHSARHSPVPLCCLLLLALILQGSLVNCQPGPPGYDTCDGHDSCIGWSIVEWSSWSPCSHTCGGGTRTREGVWQCYCDPWFGKDHGNIRCVDVPKKIETLSCSRTCSQQGDYVSNLRYKGCKCYDAYGVPTLDFPLFYGYCCENDCPRIQWCDKYWCTYYGPPSTCTQCDQHGSSQVEDQAYWLDNNLCKPRCNWLDHWCWPGTCDTSNQYLASTCQCTQGFVMDTPDATTTKCKLVEKPRIETCRLGMEGDGGEAFNSTFVGNTTSCANTRDTFVNLPPAFFHFHFDFAFELPEDPPSKHKYVHDFSFGIIAASVRLIHYSRNGGVGNTVWERAMPEEANCTDQDFTKTYPVGGTLITCRANLAYSDTPPEDGDMICHNFKPIGSGFVNIRNLVDMSGPVLHFYDETETDAEKCFRFDFVSPNHCMNQNPPCAQDPLDIGERVQRHRSITAVFQGHFDPPPPGTITGPSLIEKYLIQVHHVQWNENSLKVDMKIDQDYEVFAGTEVLEFEINPIEEPQPMMYSIYLHVVDIAGNARIMRRFVLIDNTSSLAIDDQNPLNPISASPSTAYLWQVNLRPIIVNWVDHFHNDYFIKTNLLLPIEPDEQVDEIFDQIDGTLPVSGTPNVHGITSFSYKFDKWSPTSNQSSHYQEIPDVTAQQVVLNELQIEDGDTVDVSVLATDINGDTIDDSFRVFVDSSPPILQNLWLVKDGYKQLFVHSSKDLTEMDFVFEALDPHSSLKTVKWTLGSTPKGSDIGKGALPVVKLNTTCQDPELCSCPIIGPCCLFNFAVDLNLLIADGTDIGNHNREYHFSVEVTNEAHLVSVEDVTILVDDSPPEPGVVINGPPGSRDRDYQSDDLLQWHWRSFVDHESGISKYHYAVSRECFTTDELQNLEDFANDSRVLDLGETSREHAEYVSNQEGRYHLTVIAFNHAMGASAAVCSNPLVIDKSPPELQHIRFHTARTQEAIICDSNTSIWHLTADAIAKPLTFHMDCERHCQQLTDVSRFYQEYDLSNNGTMLLPPVALSVELCGLLPTYSPDQLLFVPTDTIELSWGSTELLSQVHDFFIGVASSKENVELPDLVQYKSTHNRTHYKCAHCGLGEGERFVVQLKATNKAGLSQVASIGPVIIDLSPPRYDSGVKLETGQTFVLTWPATAFYDDEDSELLTHYQWAVGTTNDPQCVEDWAWVRVAHHEVTESYVFRVDYPADRLHAYDQDHGGEYIFSVKVFNRAGLSVTTSTAPYQMHSQVLPSAGRIFHVPKTNIGEEHIQEIGFQEDTEEICVKWTGFYHHNNELVFSLGIGTVKGTNDVVASSIVDNIEAYCFSGLALDHLKPYFVNIFAYNTHGGINVTSPGIFVSSKAKVQAHARVDDGLDCSLPFKVLETDLHLTQGQQKTISLLEAPSGFAFYTLAFEHEWNEDFSSFEISTHSELVENYSWRFSDNTVIQFFKVPFMEVNQTVLVVAKSEVRFHSVSLSPCIKDQTVQASTRGLRSAWTFRPEVLSAVSHYRVSVEEFFCSPQPCQSGGEIYPETIVPKDQFVAYLQLHPTHSYKTSVQPCFGPSCVGAVSSSGIVIDPYPATSPRLSCTISPRYSLLEDTSYVVNASWGVLRHVEGLRDASLSVYDWSVAASPTGGSILMPWRRVKVAPGDADVQVSSEDRLPMHYRKTVYLLVRAYNDWHVQSLESVQCELQGGLAPLTAPVYDLPLDYPGLDALNDILHSNQIGDELIALHDAEVDFSGSTLGISGALHGTACHEHEWFVQEDPHVNCRTDRRHTTCKKRRVTATNVVEFRNMELQHAHRYVICVHASNGTCGPRHVTLCSNGFVVDTQPPVPGSVYVGHGAADTAAAIPDNTSLHLRWQGFSDVEAELEIPYASGIKEYFYAIGTALGNDDAVKFTPVGLSDHVTASNLSLQSGQSYYMSIKACDHVSQCSVSSTPPILVDASPPVPGRVSVRFLQDPAVPLSHNVLVQWRDFSDPDSGLAGYELGVGSAPGSQDVSVFSPVSGASHVFDDVTRMQDGRQYYFQIKAVNRAGLWSIASSGPVLYDSSPPAPGYVRFGEPGQDPLRYTRDVTSLRVYWGGFADRGSGIVWYRWCVGEQQGECDVSAWEDAGLATSVVRLMSLRPGTAYYVSVEACNGALLCSRADSGPLIADNSAPLPGQVTLGGGGGHSMYTSSNTSLVASWLNFHDPQSGVRSYEWCIGSSPHACDVHPLSTAHQSLSQYVTGLDLPLNQPLYISVLATNNVGLNISGHSPAFTVDKTPPEVLEMPKLSPHASLKPGTQYDRSTISLSWRFEDAESPVWSHSVSVRTHHDSQGPVDSLLVGDVAQVTTTLSEASHLKDGNRYVASVTACNAAGLCSTAESPEFLVDASPPHLGGFVDGLLWENSGTGSVVHLSWGGFDDAHSGIAVYYIMVSSSYNGYDLSEGVLKVAHNESGELQTGVFALPRQIAPYNMVYLSIWAENGVGLVSDAAKVGVLALKTSAQAGRLDIEKHSCDAHYCTGDCTCAVVNRPCSPGGETLPTCQDIDSSAIQVYDGPPGSPITMTSSTTCLQAFWESSNASRPVMRYEWTVGAKGSEPGTPIFDLIHEKFWFDVELHNNWVYCLPKGKTLTQGLYYVFYVRAWYSFEEYSVHSSEGIIVDSTPPRIGMGRAVLDTDASFQEDIDFTTDASHLYSTWASVFGDAESGIDHYEVSVGTTQGGNEVFGPQNVQQETRLSLSELNLTPGFRYFTTVHAYNSLGLVTSSSSNGVVLDLLPPLAGVVFSSLTFQDASHHMEQLSASWHGFEDQHSFIERYEWAIGLQAEDVQSLTFHNCGLETSIRAGMGLGQGAYVVYVRAYDAAGHVSPLVASRPVTMDATPPIGLQCQDFEDIPGDWSFVCSRCDTAECSDEYQVCSAQAQIPAVKNQFLKVMLAADHDHEALRARLEVGGTWDWIHFERDGPAAYSHYTTVLATATEAVTPRVYLFKGDLSNVLTSVQVCAQPETSAAPVTLRQSGSAGIRVHWSVADPESGIGSVEVGLGSNPGGFQLLPLTDVGQSSSLLVFPRALRHGENVHAVLVAENGAGGRSVFRPAELTVDATPPLLSDVQVTVLPAAAGDTCSVHATWHVTEEESHVQDCHWSIGRAPGGEDLLPLSRTPSLDAASADGVKVQHGDSLYVTVSCSNARDLSGTVTAPATVVVSRPPVAPARATFFPQSRTTFPARHDAQADGDVLEVGFPGFSDVTGIAAYEYRVTGSWQRVPVTDHLLLTGSYHGNVNVSVRAVNTGGLLSTQAMAHGTVDERTPALTGARVSVHLRDGTMTVTWRNVFSWRGAGQLHYVLYVGTELGAADVVTGLETQGEELDVTSGLWVAPGECFVAVTAVAPSGLFVTYTELVEY